MKHTLLSLTFLLSLAGANASYYEDHPVVAKMAKSGKPVITKNAKECPKRYGNKKLTDRLGKADRWNSLCVESTKLPGKVLREVMDMAANELENDSDYDSRVTRLYTFNQDEFHPESNLSASEVAKLAKAFSIPKSQSENFKVSAFVGSKDSFSQFDYIMTGTDSDGYEDSQTLKFLRKKASGKLVLEIQMGEEIDLYPGGGFRVDHSILILDGEIIYVKHSWWDA